MARRKKTSGDTIEIPKADLEEYIEKLARADQALTAARTGLFKIANINPTTFTVTPGKSLKIVKAFERAQEVAEKTLLKVSDLENTDEL